tara:strand:+ start:660 stop:2516 length:1857 start_codon:yes stop_codon:yes gene_type:complete
MIYSNQYATGNKPIGIASLSAILKREGHDFKLFDCTQFSIIRKGEFSDWNKTGEKALQFMQAENQERLPDREKVTYEQLIDKVIEEISSYNPNMIGLSALSDDYPLGLRIMEKVKKKFNKIPTIAGGVHATIDPAGVIAEDCFDMVCVGEGEYVMLDIAKRSDQNKNFSKIKNLWIKNKDGSIEKNIVRPYEQNLDLFPHPDWSIYPETAFYKPYKGKVYKYGDFEMSRGCPYKCSYCINVQLQAIYKKTGENYHREKSIKRVIEEIKLAIKKYDIEFIKFWDETFLLMSKERLEEFAELYTKEIGLPYVIETTSQSITPFTSKLLKKSNCKSVSLGLETGSPDLRNGLLHKPTGNEVYLKAFKLLEENGIQKVAYNMIGLPYEKQEDIFKTIAMNKLCKTDTQTSGKFYPYKGTPIRRMLIEKGLLKEDKEKELLKGYDLNSLTDYQSVLDFNAIDTDLNAEILNKFSLLFGNYVIWPVKLWPLIDLIKNTDEDDSFVNLLWKKVNDVTYFKKFKQWPPNSQISKDYLEKNTYELDDAKANNFCNLLISIWGDEYNKRIREILSEIESNLLNPEFPIPEDDQGLKYFLGIEKITEEQKRIIRQELRDIAKKDSEAYI